MDGECFDDLARRFASGLSRRRVLEGLGGAALAAPGQALAACLRNGRRCTEHAGCCSGYCDRFRDERSCAACASGVVCGDVCCPDGALNACGSIAGPNGPVVVCVCPDGTLYDPSANVCRPCGGKALAARATTIAARTSFAPAPAARRGRSAGDHIDDGCEVRFANNGDIALDLLTAEVDTDGTRAPISSKRGTGPIPRAMTPTRTSGSTAKSGYHAPGQKGGVI